MTDDRHDTEATTTRKDGRGPIVAGPDAREAEKPVKSGDAPAGKPAGKAPQQAKPVTPTHAGGKDPTPGP